MDTNDTKNLTISSLLKHTLALDLQTITRKFVHQQITKLDQHLSTLHVSYIKTNEVPLYRSYLVVLTSRQGPIVA